MALDQKLEDQRVPDFDDVRKAAERLHGQARRTPLLAGTPLDEVVGFGLFLKLENLQHTGSFKIRGAFNRLAKLDAQQRKAGVVAFSSGNHAQGVAEAARRLGIPATIVMPSDAPRVKLENTRALGATVIEYDRSSESREQIAEQLARTRGAVLVPSFDDPDVIAGQGTVGIELIEQASEQGVELDDLVVPCSGGGLAAGIAIAVHAMSPRTRIWTAEPADFNDHQRSFAAGRRLRNRPDAESCCDALLAPEPGVITFEINRRLLAGGVCATDEQVLQAIAISARQLKLVLEPGGAAALACVLSGRLSAAGRNVAVVLSGGNIDPAALARILIG